MDWALLCFGFLRQNSYDSELRPALTVCLCVSCQMQQATAGANTLAGDDKDRRNTVVSVSTH